MQRRFWTIGKFERWPDRAALGQKQTYLIMTKFLAIDLSSGIPGPEARPEHADLQRLRKDPKYGVNRGRACEATWGMVRVTVLDDRERAQGLTDFMLTVPFWIVSRRFVALLRSYDSACEYLPLECTYRKKSLPDEFFALNVLNVERSAADIERSEFDRRHLELGLMMDVEKLVLKDDPIGRAPIAFLGQIGQIAVCDDLARDIAATLVGVRLVKPEAYTS